MAAPAGVHPVTIMVHGGAGFIADEYARVAGDGVCAAADAGYAVLQAGGSALDAVEAAVRVLEELPFFNAGRGSVLTREGRVEMDASIVDGEDIRVGAVTAVTNVVHPITLARHVLTNSPHALLAADGAAAFARSVGMPCVENDVLITPIRRAQLAAVLAQSPPSGTAQARSSAPAGGVLDVAHLVKDTVAQGAVPLLPPRLQDSSCSVRDVEAPRAPCTAAPHCEGHATVTPHAGSRECAAHTSDEGPPADAGDHDTVGAVALDAFGRLAAATSTGGLTGKWPGRVGDSPLLGAGSYADRESGACSTTGAGEFIMRALLAKRCCDAFATAAGRLSAPPSSTAAQCVAAARSCVSASEDSVSVVDGAAVEAACASLASMHRRVGGPGAGLIFVSRDGGAVAAHTSARMSWAVRRGVVGDSAPSVSEHGIEAPLVCDAQFADLTSKLHATRFHAPV